MATGSFDDRFLRILETIVVYNQPLFLTNSVKMKCKRNKLTHMCFDLSMFFPPEKAELKMTEELMAQMSSLLEERELSDEDKEVLQNTRLTSGTSMDPMKA